MVDADAAAPNKHLNFPRGDPATLVVSADDTIPDTLVCWVQPWGSAPSDIDDATIIPTRAVVGDTVTFSFTAEQNAALTRKHRLVLRDTATSATWASCTLTSSIDGDPESALALDFVNGTVGVTFNLALFVGADPGGGSGLPDGGTTGQILAKASDTDQDYEFLSRNAPNGYAGLDEDGTIPDVRIPASIARDSEVGSAVAQRVRWRGDFADAEGGMFEVNDLVVFSGGLYICTVATVENPSDEPTEWDAWPSGGGDTVWLLDGTTAIPAEAITGVALGDVQLYYRGGGDLNHSMGWAFPRHGKDGPGINGLAGGVLTAGDANAAEEVVVLDWAPDGVTAVNADGELQPVVLDDDPRLGDATQAPSAAVRVPSSGLLTGIGGSVGSGTLTVAALDSLPVGGVVWLDGMDSSADDGFYAKVSTSTFTKDAAPAQYLDSVDYIGQQVTVSFDFEVSNASTWVVRSTDGTTSFAVKQSILQSDIDLLATTVELDGLVPADLDYDPSGLFIGADNVDQALGRAEGILDRWRWVSATSESNIDVSLYTAPVSDVPTQPALDYGITPPRGSYIFLHGQTDPSENGIWLVGFDDTNGVWVHQVHPSTFEPPGNGYRVRLNAPGSDYDGRQWTWSSDDVGDRNRGHITDLVEGVTGRWIRSDPTDRDTIADHESRIDTLEAAPAKCHIVGGQNSGSAVSATTTPTSLLDSTITLPASGAGTTFDIEGTISLVQNSGVSQSHTLGVYLGGSLVFSIAGPSLSNSATPRVINFEAHIRLDSATLADAWGAAFYPANIQPGQAVDAAVAFGSTVALDVRGSMGSATATQTLQLRSVSVKRTTT